MVKVKPLSTFMEGESPRVLIIGGGTVASYLTHSFENKLCKVTFHDFYRPSMGKYDYVLQFGQIEKAGEILMKHRNNKGKYVFVEANEDEEGIKEVKDTGFKAVRVGQVNLWSVPVLAENIMKVLFSQAEGSVVDIRKKITITKSSYAIPVVSQESKKFAKIALRESESIPNKNTKVKPVSQTPSVNYTTVTKSTARRGVIFIFICFILFILTLSFYIYLYINSLKNIYANFRNHLAQSDWSGVTLDISQAKEKLSLGKKVYDYSYKYLIPLRYVPYFHDLDIVLSVSDDLLNTASDSISFFRSYKMAGASPFAVQNKITKADIEKTDNFTKGLFQTLIKAQGKLENTSLPFFPKESYLTLISSYQDKLSMVGQVLPLVGGIFTQSGQKSYLVLFQNNMELRATGGFIGSFGVLTVLDGTAKEFKVIDVYSADGQLKGHVDPPPAIRKYLSQPNWFLRDSNFDPDFATTSIQAAWFLEKETGQKVDGVIGVNLFLAENLLRVMGEVKLPDFNDEVISADNFFFKSQQFIEKDFFAGSSKKKDYLTAVTNAMTLKLETDRNLPWLELLGVVKNSLEEKNILLYFKDPDLQKDMEKAGWAGRMVDVGCVNGNMEEASEGEFKNECISDYLSVIESNFGVNKANYFVEKSIAVEKKINESGLLVTILTLSYENNPVSQVLNGGDYQNYLRIFVPKGSTLLNLTLNNMPLSPTDVEVEPYGPDKTVFAYFLKIGSGNKGALKISYTLPFAFSRNTSSYQFFYQKQPGAKYSPLVISLTYPDNFNLSPVNLKSTAGGSGEIFYATDTSVDRIFAFEVSLK